jgi:hypothetical protein
MGIRGEITHSIDDNNCDVKELACLQQRQFLTTGHVLFCTATTTFLIIVNTHSLTSD